MGAENFTHYAAHSLFIHHLQTQVSCLLGSAFSQLAKLHIHIKLFLYLFYLSCLASWLHLTSLFSLFRSFSWLSSVHLKWCNLLHPIFLILSTWPHHRHTPVFITSLRHLLPCIQLRSIALAVPQDTITCMSPYSLQYFQMPRHLLSSLCCMDCFVQWAIVKICTLKSPIRFHVFTAIT